MFCALRHRSAVCFFIASFVAAALPAEVAFSVDYSIGNIGQISNTWQFPSVEAGWGPVGGVSVTMYVGSVAVPVSSLNSGNWSDPSTWSLTNLVVVYDRAKTWQDLVTGDSWVTTDTNSTSFAWPDLTSGLGPTEQSVTFPIPVADYSPIVTANLGTTLKYDTTLGSDVLLDQDVKSKSLTVLPWAQLRLQDAHSLVVDDPQGINNYGTIRLSSSTGTYTLSTTVSNYRTIATDGGTLILQSGTSSNGNYEFSNGGRIETSESYVWEGANTANGNGVLDARGRVLTSATFDSANFTNGAALAITGGLRPEAGATLTFNFTGTSTATLVSGGWLGGDGTTFNLVNFRWTG